MGRKIMSLPYFEPEHQPNPEIQSLCVLVFLLLLLSLSLFFFFKKLKYNFSWHYFNIRIVIVMTAVRMATWWKHAMTSRQWLRMNEKNSLKETEIFKRVKVRILVCVNFHSWYNPNKMFSSFLPKSRAQSPLLWVYSSKEMLQGFIITISKRFVEMFH